MNPPKQTADWREQLLMSGNGAPRPLFANAITALRYAPAWQNVLAFNEFARETWIMSAPPWDMRLSDWQPRPWAPQDDLHATEWLQRENIAVTMQIAAQAVESVAHDRCFHPVGDYLESLEWDGEPRLSTWVPEFLGAAPNVYHGMIGKLLMIAAVARIYDPGCKVDNVPILEGNQGTRKSTAVRTLFAPWFTDEIAEIGSKDAAMQTRGVWCVELAELDAMNRMEVSRIKAFITRTTDRFRPPYGVRTIESPRSCVFWGTTNTDTYLKDETGGRRFWPIKTNRIDIDGLADVREQLWAEARVLYQAGHVWWIDKAELRDAAQEQQAARYVGDAWDGPIARYAETEPKFSIEDVMRNALGIETARQTQADANRVARVLRSLGCVRSQSRIGDRRVWQYRKLVTSGDSRLVTSGDKRADDGRKVRTDTNVTTSILVTRDQVVTPQGIETQGLSPLSPLSPVDKQFDDYESYRELPVLSGDTGDTGDSRHPCQQCGHHGETVEAHYSGVTARLHRDCLDEWIERREASHV